MEYEEIVEVEKLLEELSTYGYSQIKPRVARIKELLKSDLEGQKRSHYRLENKLKSSVDKDVVKEVSTAQATLSGIKTMYQRAYDEVGYHNNATSDLLHALELLDDDDLLMAHATQLRETRQMRREAKDFQELMNPMVSFINHNGKAIKEFNEAVNEMRKIQEGMAGRRYTTRVKTDIQLAFDKAFEKEQATLAK